MSILKEKFELINNEFGIELEEFGINSIKIDAIPTWIKEDVEHEIVTYVINQVINNENVSIEKIMDDMIIMMACKMSIKANHSLSNYYLEELLKETVSELKQEETL